MKCGKFFTLNYIKSSEGVPRCECGGVIKPDVVLYEESLDDKTVEGAVAAIQKADVLIVGGTSLTVYPAAGFLRYYKGNHLVLINKTRTPIDDKAELALYGSIGDILRRQKNPI